MIYDKEEALYILSMSPTTEDLLQVTEFIIKKQANNKINSEQASFLYDIIQCISRLDEGFEKRYYCNTLIEQMSQIIK